MVGGGDVFLVDATFLFGANEKAFLGAPLLVSPQGQDNTVSYGVFRDLLRLRRAMGIQNAIVLIGKDTRLVSTESNIQSALRLLNRLGATAIHEPGSSVASLSKNVASVAGWVITRNRALFQLIREQFGVVIPGEKGTVEMVTAESIRADLGVRPEQVPSFLALTDGEKGTVFTRGRAIRLLEVYGDLEKLLGDVSTVASPQLRRQLSANRLELLRRLRALRFEEDFGQPLSFANSDLTFLRDDDESREALREYGFPSLCRLLPLSRTPTVKVVTHGKDRRAYRAVVDAVGLRELEAVLLDCSVCAVDTEASEKDPRKASLFGVAFSAREGEGFYVPLTEADLDGVSPQSVQTFLSRAFSRDTRFLGHNLKYDYVVLRKHGIRMKHVYFDTMVAAAECFGDWDFFNLGAVARRILGRDIKRYRDIVGEGETLLDVPFRDLVEHACVDAETTLRLFHSLQNELEMRGIEGQFINETMLLLKTLGDRECDGVKVNPETILRGKRTLEREASDLRRAIISETNREFDVDSMKEVSSVLWSLGLLGEVGGNRGVTSVQLEQLAYRHGGLVRLIVRYHRTRQRVRQLESLCTSVKDDKVFPLFSQIGSEHGGLGSRDPRIFELGGHMESGAVVDEVIREQMPDCSVALGILQRVTHDPVLKRDRRRKGQNWDFTHLAGCLPDVNAEDLLISVAIGLSDSALCKRFLIDPMKVAAIRNAIESRYSRLFSWLDRYRRDAVAQGFAAHAGRRKYLEGLRSSDLGRRSRATRSAVRWLIKY